MNITFSHYKASKRGGITIVKTDLNRSPLEKWGIIAGLYVATLVVFGLIAYFLPNLWFGWLDFIVAAIIDYLLLKRFSIDILGVKILTIDKNADNLESNLEKFSTPLSNITSIAIFEQNLQIKDYENKIYHVKLILKNGEKTLPFACTSYNVLKDLINVIKQ